MERGTLQLELTETSRAERRTTRRWWMIGGLSTLGLAAGGAYSVSPRFWKQFSKEMSRPIVNPLSVPDPASWPDRGVHAAWLGHATVLLKIDGFTLITDPALYSRIGLDFRLFTLGLKRIVAPALTTRQLPKLDLVLLSHAHMDHFDLPTLRALENKSVDLVTASGTSDLLNVDRWRSVQELRWGQRARVGAATLRAFEVKHWGARMRSDTWRGYNGYAIEVGRHRVLFGGDTADTHLFRQLHTARGFDLMLMPIGAYNPWIRNHCTPEQAWRMGNDAGGHFFLPIHHQTFALSNEPVHEPLARFMDAAGSSVERVAVQSVGGEVHFG